MKKKIFITIIILCIGGGLGAGYYFLFSHPNKPANVVIDNTPFGWKYPVAKFPSTGSGGELAYSNIRDPGGIPQGLPVRIKIPNIGVDSTIEDALITPDGRMDVPIGSVNVAWFSLGPHPGKVGSAVIGGHFGIKDGVPFVFYNLDKLLVGDKVYIVDDRDDTLAFVVRSIKSFDRNADATTVFTSQDGIAHLNIITCEGIWNQVNGTYPQRLVVFTDAVPLGSIDEAAVTFRRSLDIGAQGVDVEALQIILEQKGFLSFPPGIAKGFFGALTRVALTKYQTSVGLPSVGIFGPMTRAKLVSELGNNPSLPNTAIGPGVEQPSTSLQTIIQYGRSLFTTPMDGLITFLLLISIALLIFKIVRR